MNRIIKFRALKDDMSNCNFVYGQLVYDAIGTPRITEVDKSGEGLTFHSCLKGTEGQFTGLTDKNGTDIYEGDTDITGILVKWDEIAASFICVRDGSFIGHLGEISNLLLITGNIHENPELIK